MLSGMTPLAANITSTVALFPGQVTSGLAGRRLVTGAGPLPFWALFVTSALGGALGGLLLLKTPSAMFAHLVPWLVLFATAVFAWGSFSHKPRKVPKHLGPVKAAVAQFMIAIYGGYFGGGHRVFDDGRADDGRPSDAKRWGDEKRAGRCDERIGCGAVCDLATTTLASGHWRHCRGLAWLVGASSCQREVASNRDRVYWDRVDDRSFHQADMTKS